MLRQYMKYLEVNFRQCTYCLQNLGITCIAYSFSPFHECLHGLPVTYMCVCVCVCVCVYIYIFLMFHKICGNTYVGYTLVCMCVCVRACTLAYLISQYFILNAVFAVYIIYIYILVMWTDLIKLYRCLQWGSNFLLHLHVIADCCHNYMSSACLFIYCVLCV